MVHFEKLSKEEREFLIKAPVYMSLLAANAHGKMDGEERHAAIRQSHFKTFPGDPMLEEFYEEVEKKFEDNIQQLDSRLPKDKHEREVAIKAELEKLETIYQKLGEEFSVIIHKSLNAYYDHVSNAHWSVFASMLFPFPDALRR